MKEIKAYIRTSNLTVTIEALRQAGVPGITVVAVHPIGYDFNGRDDSTGPEKDADNQYSVSKIEVVAADDDADRFAEIISGNSYTGESGDGLIFISAVEKAIKIRTGEQGNKALTGREGKKS